MALTSDQWQSLLEVVDAAALSVKARKEVRPGCTGGTSESVSLSAGGGQLLAGSLAHCGGEEEGDLHGDIKAVKAAMKGLFSDWDAVIARE